MDRNYQRNRTGNIVGSETENGEFVYGYDPIDQLTNAVNPVLGAEAYAYDPAGNRLHSSTPANEDTDYVANELNQYTSVSNRQSAFAEPPADESVIDIRQFYDLNGNLTQKVANGVSQIFRWDIENRLIAYSNTATGVAAAYAYDPFGRRIRKTIGGTNTTWYLYADEGLVAEMDASGNITRTYGYAPNALWNNNTLWMRTDGHYYYYLNDHLGAPQKLVTRNGEVVWSAVFESFGQAVVSSNSTIVNNLRFSSQYFDDESGLHYNTYRYYDPENGRYISRDPIGEDGGINQYRFAANNLINLIDHDGLDVHNLSAKWVLVKYGKDTKSGQVWIPLEPSGTFVGPNDGVMWDDGTIFKVSGDNADIEIDASGGASTDSENYMNDVAKELMPGKQDRSGWYKKGDQSRPGKEWNPGSLLDVIRTRNSKQIIPCEGD